MYQGCLKITDKNLEGIITKLHAMQAHRAENINLVKLWKITGTILEVWNPLLKLCPIITQMA